MTDDDLREIEGRANAATAGPWYDHNVDDDYCMNAFVVTTSEREPDVSVDERTNTHREIVAGTLLQTPRIVDHESQLWDKNAAFIAHARTDVPALVAEVRRLREENERLRGWLRGELTLADADIDEALKGGDAR